MRRGLKQGAFHHGLLNLTRQDQRPDAEGIETLEAWANKINDKQCQDQRPDAEGIET